MKIVFRDNNPVNTVVLDESGTPLYEIDTPVTLFGGMTTIRRIDWTSAQGSGPSRNVVSQIDWSSMGHLVRLPGSGGLGPWQDVDSYLVRKGMLSKWVLTDSTVNLWSFNSMNRKVHGVS
jgi:hypothetical protein